MNYMKFLISENYLQVGEVHHVYYQVYGNPNGEPILFIHGGPGAGFSESDKRFFDFSRHKVIFFDQRGASKSKPFGCIKDNTTQHLVDDINNLLRILKIEKVHIFGGSWGTTLSLVYAIQNPKRVLSLLLRGLFLGNKKSIDHYLNGGVKHKFPKVWNRFVKNIPQSYIDRIASFYLDKMQNGTKEELEHYSYEWAFYEISIFKEDINDIEVKDILKEMPYKSLSIMEAHYYSNGCFIEENYIIKNIDLIKHLPIVMVHGKNDIICPVEFVVEFNELLLNSQMYIENSGHSDKETEIEERLMRVINELY